MAKKPSYKEFKPFQKDSGKDTSYRANSDGVNNELGPKIILPPRPINEGKSAIGNLSNLRNPSSGKYAIADLSHLHNKNTKIKMPEKTPGNSADYNDWPLSKFAFRVNIGGFSGELSFQGMDGLGATVGKMEFRDGNSSKFYKQTRPTLTSYDPVTLKKGMFVGDTVLFDWFKNVSQGSLFSDMRTVTIDLCEHQGGELTSIFKWTLEKAYITKFTPSNLDGEADTEVAIEEVELTYQSFSMDSGGLLGSLGGLFGSAGGVLGKIANALPGIEKMAGNINKGITGKIAEKIGGKIKF